MASKMADLLFGQWLEKMLHDYELTQAQLARKAGVTRGAINGVISGARGPGPDLCTAIARAFQIPPEKVFREAGLLPLLSEDDELAERAEHLLRSFKTEQYRQIAVSQLENLLIQETKAAYNAGLKPAEQET